MRITICLSERVTDDLVESARTFRLSPQQILLQGPGLVGGSFEVMASTGGHLAIRQRVKNGDLVTPLPTPTLEQFRQKPGVRAFLGSPGDLGGMKLEGTVFEVTFSDSDLEEIRGVLKADSPLEAYSFALWLYLALLRTARDYPGGEVGVVSPKENRFYSCKP